MPRLIPIGVRRHIHQDGCEEIAVRKPLNHNDFQNNNPTRSRQSMLKRRRRFRYDPPLTQEPSWSDTDRDHDPDAQEFDMDVTGAAAMGGAAPIRPTQSAPASGVQSASGSGIVAPQDEVQISSAARALGQIDAAAQIHEARLAIADGTYETPDKLDAAVDRLIEALRRDAR